MPSLPDANRLTSGSDGLQVIPLAPLGTFTVTAALSLLRSGYRPVGRLEARSSILSDSVRGILHKTSEAAAKPPLFRDVVMRTNRLCHWGGFAEREEEASFAVW